MGERNQTQTKTDDGMDDLYDPSLSEFGDDDFDALEDSCFSFAAADVVTCAGTPPPLPREILVDVIFALCPYELPLLPLLGLYGPPPCLWAL